MNTTITVYSHTCPPFPIKHSHTKEHILGLSLLCFGLFELYGLSFSADSILSEIKKGKSKKPYLFNYPYIHFNISHCEGMIVCAFSSTSVGIDVEGIRPVSYSLAKKALTQAELSFISTFSQESPEFQKLFSRFWTLKESLAKCTSYGITDSLFKVNFQFLNFPDSYEVTCSEKDFYFYHRDFDSQKILSICSKEPIKKVKFISVEKL